MKKLVTAIILAICALALAVVLSGCSSSVDSAEATDGSNPAPVADVIEDSKPIPTE